MDYKKKWNEAMTYTNYRKLVKDLIENDKVTGPNQSENLLEYSKLNQHRMNRLDKTISLDSMLEASDFEIDPSMKIMVITEGWCGDASQIVPVINALANHLGIEIRLLLRDEHLDVIDLHLVNGGRSIPIVLVFNQAFDLLTTWGPRPKPLQQLVLDYKNSPEPKEEYSEFTKKIHLWYAQDKQKSLISEWLTLLNGLKKN